MIRWCTRYVVIILTSQRSLMRARVQFCWKPFWMTARVILRYNLRAESFSNHMLYWLHFLVRTRINRRSSGRLQGGIYAHRHWRRWSHHRLPARYSHEISGTKIDRYLAIIFTMTMLDYLNHEHRVSIRKRVVFCFLFFFLSNDILVASTILVDRIRSIIDRSGTMRRSRFSREGNIRVATTAGVA